MRRRLLGNRIGGVVETNLIYHVNSIDTNSYNPNDPTKWNDIIGGRVGMLQGAASFNSVENSIKTTSAEDFLRLNTAINISSGSDFSFGCFFKANGWSMGNPGFWRIGTPSDNFNIFQGTTGIPWIRWNQADILKPTTGASISLGTYVYVVFAVHSHTIENPGYVKFMINGVEHYNLSHTRPTSGFNLVDLLRHNSTESIFGEFRDLRFYDGVITEEDASINYTNLINLYGI